MTRLTEIQRHIASMSELQDIVGAMRSLAGMRMHEALAAQAGVRRYADSMAAAIGAALHFLPARPAAAEAPGRRIALVFAAEHGFVGGFNDRILEAAERASTPRDLLFVMGSRGAAIALERGRKLEWYRPMPSRAAGAPDAARNLAAVLYGRIARGEVSRVDLMFARYRQGSPAAIERRLLLPLDLKALAGGPRREAPLHNLEPGILVEKLVAEYVFALLTEAAIESIASENAARFAAMESAHDNVGRKLDQLLQAGRQARQDEITTELLDLVTGVEAQVRPRAKVRAIA